MSKFNYENGITHSGVFHGDDVFATAFLRIIKSDIKISRTFKVPDNIDESTTVVYDIGGGRFDHHQKDGNGCRENGIKYSSFGLLWNEYFDQIPNMDPETAQRISDDFIQSIDAQDNGQMNFGNELDFRPFTISSAISTFNPNWDDKNICYDVNFAEAVTCAEKILRNIIAQYISKKNAENIVNDAVKERKDKLIILPQFCPWQDHVISNPDANDCLYVIFPSDRGGWNIQAIPASLGSFSMRKPLPKEWWGLTNEKLEEVSKVKGVTFCHANGFLASGATKEVCIELGTVAANN